MGRVSRLLAGVLAVALSTTLALPALTFADQSGVEGDVNSSALVAAETATSAQVPKTQAEDQKSLLDYYKPVLQRAHSGSDEFKESYDDALLLWSPQYGLYDLDHDGIPELLVHANGSYFYGSVKWHLYTIRDGEVVHEGKLGPDMNAMDLYASDGELYADTTSNALFSDVSAVYKMDWLQAILVGNTGSGGTIGDSVAYLESLGATRLKTVSVTDYSLFDEFDQVPDSDPASALVSDLDSRLLSGENNYSYQFQIRGLSQRPTFKYVVPGVANGAFMGKCVADFDADGADEALYVVWNGEGFSIRVYELVGIGDKAILSAELASSLPSAGYSDAFEPYGDYDADVFYNAQDNRIYVQGWSNGTPMASGTCAVLLQLSYGNGSLSETNRAEIIGSNMSVAPFKSEVASMGLKTDGIFEDANGVWNGLRDMLADNSSNYRLITRLQGKIDADYGDYSWEKHSALPSDQAEWTDPANLGTFKVISYQKSGDNGTSNQQRFTLEDTYPFKNYDRLISLNVCQEMFGSAFGYVLWNGDVGDGGNCFGMVATIAAIKQHDAPAVHTFSRSYPVGLLLAKSINQVQRKSSSSAIGMTAEDYISYGQLAQYHPGFVAVLEGNEEKSKNDLGAFAQAAEAALATESEPLHVSLGGTYDGKSSGHALLLMGIGENSSSKTVYLVYDCNHVGEISKLILYKNAEGEYCDWEYQLFDDVTWGSNQRDPHVSFSWSEPGPWFIAQFAARGNIAVLPGEEERLENKLSSKYSYFVRTDSGSVVLVSKGERHVLSREDAKEIERLLFAGGADAASGITPNPNQHYWADVDKDMSVEAPNETTEFEVTASKSGINLKLAANAKSDLRCANDEHNKVDIHQSDGDEFMIEYYDDIGASALDIVKLSGVGTAEVKTQQTDSGVEVTGVKSLTATNDQEVTTRRTDMDPNETYTVLPGDDTRAPRIIAESERVDLAKATMSVADQTYTGSALTPPATVVVNGTTLQQDVDYTLEYADNINVGTAKATATGIGAYKGTASTTFQIKGAASKEGGSTRGNTSNASDPESAQGDSSGTSSTTTRGDSSGKASPSTGDSPIALQLLWGLVMLSALVMALSAILLRRFPASGNRDGGR